MNKKNLRLGILLQILICIFLIQIVSGLPTVTTNFPVNDCTDDIYYNSDGSQENFIGSGDFYDCIDVITVNITGNDILVKFASAGTRSGANYTFNLHIDVNNDNDFDFGLGYSTIAGGYVLQNQDSDSDHFGYFWTGSSWLAGMTFKTPVTDSGVILNLSTVVTALDVEGLTLSTSKFRLVVGYINMTEYAYVDFVPEQQTTTTAIPAFHWIIALSALFSIIMLRVFYNKEK